MYSFDSFAKLYGRNQHNTVKQLSSNKKKKKKRKNSNFYIKETNISTNIYLVNWFLFTYEQLLKNKRGRKSRYANDKERGSSD